MIETGGTDLGLISEKRAFIRRRYIVDSSKLKNIIYNSMMIYAFYNNLIYYNNILN